VTGAIIATGGSLMVSTRGSTYTIHPQDDGTSKKQLVGPYEKRGTSIKVRLGLSVTDGDLSWGEWAISLSSHGTLHKNGTSPFWYNSESFYELVNAAEMPVNRLLSYMCGLKKDTRLRSEYAVTHTREMDFAEAEDLLTKLRSDCKPVASLSIGEVGDVFLNFEYAKKAGTYTTHSIRGKNHAEIPFVVEAWVQINADNSSRNRSTVTMSVNKTPVTTDVKASTKRPAPRSGEEACTLI
jgi:hypothetical protein